MQTMFKILILVCGLVAVVHAAGLDYDALCPGYGFDTCDDTKNLYCYQEFSTRGCTAAKCSCIRGFKRVGDACVTGLSLGEMCTPATDACNVINGECVTDTCACSVGFIPLAEFCIPATFKKIGETCTTATDTCYYESEGKLVDIYCPSVIGATTTTCQCGANTKQFGTTSCRPIKIGDSCAQRIECPTSSTCSGDPKVCTCYADVYAATTDKTACVIITDPIADGQPGEPCPAQCAAGLVCSICRPDLYRMCVQRTGLLARSCTIASDCASNVAVCTENKCACPTGYEAFGVTQCLITGNLDSVCLDTGDCTTPHAACTNRKCACAAGYYKEGNACIQECTTANAATLCPAASNKECDYTETKTCKCLATFLVRGDTCVSGAGMKAAWISIVLLSGLIPGVMRMLR